MTKKLSTEDEKKMKEVFNETPEEAMRRMQFWRNQPKEEFKALPPNQAIATDAYCHDCHFWFDFNYCPNCGTKLKEQCH